MDDETFEDLACEHGCLAYECSICDDLATERSTPFVVHHVEPQAQAQTFVAGQRVFVDIPEDAILLATPAQGLVIETVGGNGKVHVQVQGFVRAKSVRDIETGARGPGWLDSPIVALDPEHVHATNQVRTHEEAEELYERAAAWVRRHLVSHTVKVVTTLHGEEVSRLETVIPDSDVNVAWLELKGGPTGETKTRIMWDPPVPIPVMPLEYAVWEPILE